MVPLFSLCYTHGSTCWTMNDAQKMFGGEKTERYRNRKEAKENEMGRNARKGLR